MGTLIENARKIEEECQALPLGEACRKDLIMVIGLIRLSCEEGQPIDPNHIDEFINHACYLSDHAARQRESIIRTAEAFERQCSLRVLDGCGNGLSAVPRPALTVLEA